MLIGNNIASFEIKFRSETSRKEIFYVRALEDMYHFVYRLKTTLIICPAGHAFSTVVDVYAKLSGVTARANISVIRLDPQDDICTAYIIQHRVIDAERTRSHFL